MIIINFSVKLNKYNDKKITDRVYFVRLNYPKEVIGANLIELMEQLLTWWNWNLANLVNA
jgi:hypothetical protein